MELSEPVAVTSLELTPKQARFVDDVFSGRYRYMALGGAIRGTKTFGLLIVFMILMRLFPRSRWALVREDWTALQQNTLPSIEKMRETMGGWLGPFNHSTRAFTAKNGSQLLIVPESFHRDPDLNSFKGFEVNGFGLEEANELNRKTFIKAIERAGAWVIPPTSDQQARGQEPEQPPPLVLLTFNPSDAWTDEVFHEPYEQGTLAAPYYFLPLTIADNPHLPQAYLDSLEELREAAPEDYARFVEGKRGAVTQPNQLIAAHWLISAREVAYVPGPLRESVDVARFGNDETVFAGIDGNALADLEAHEKWDTRQTSIRAQTRIAERSLSADLYVVDSVGLGAGVADNLKHANYPVREFIAGASAVPRTEKDEKTGRPRPSAWRFTNLRSQAWWEFREKIRKGLFRLAPPPGKERTSDGREVLPVVAMRKLLQDLSAPRYKITSDRMVDVESKDSIKQRTGRSTDYGDAVVMAAFDFPPVLMRDLSPSRFPVIKQ